MQVNAWDLPTTTTTSSPPLTTVNALAVRTMTEAAGGIIVTVPMSTSTDSTCIRLDRHPAIEVGKGTWYTLHIR